VRIAYLIMAHDQPGHLRRMVRVLDRGQATFYIHIDRKADSAPFEAGVAKGDNIRFLRNAVKANWMGFSLVEATLRLLTAAVADGFDYCVLLSGVDYPIKPWREIETFFERADKEYIAFWRLDDRPSWKHKVEYFYPIDAIPIRDWSTNREPVYWRRLFWGRYVRYRELMPKRTFPRGMVPYGGPDWWSLSHGCASHILRFVAENPRYKSFFKYAQSPGELFFQTIILNSDWASRVENYEEYQRWSADRAARGEKWDTTMLPDESFNYRYADWSGERTGDREAPAILDERDWTNIRNTRSLFARKFDSRRSSKLLDRIDREILEVAA
jgi:hypothetical protein